MADPRKFAVPKSSSETKETPRESLVNKLKTFFASEKELFAKENNLWSCNTIGDVIEMIDTTSKIKNDLENDKIINEYLSSCLEYAMTHAIKGALEWDVTPEEEQQIKAHEERIRKFAKECKFTIPDCKTAEKARNDYKTLLNGAAGAIRMTPCSFG